MKSLLKNEVNRTLDSLIKQTATLIKAKSPRSQYDKHKEIKIKSNTIERISKDIDNVYHWFLGNVDVEPNDKKKQKCIAK